MPTNTDFGASIWELNLGLSCGWQGSNYLEHTSQDLQWQEAGIRTQSQETNPGNSDIGALTSILTASSNATL